MTESQVQEETPVSEPEGNTDEQTVFTQADLDRLEAETAEALSEARSRGDQLSELLKLRTMEQAAGDILQNVDHMPAEDDRYFDEHGFASPEGMREVAQELVAKRPYLAKVRGDVSQGARQAEQVPTWGDVLREALG